MRKSFILEYCQEAQCSGHRIQSTQCEVHCDQSSGDEVVGVDQSLLGVGWAKKIQAKVETVKVNHFQMTHQESKVKEEWKLKEEFFFKRELLEHCLDGNGNNQYKGIKKETDGATNSQS